MKTEKIIRSWLSTVRTAHTFAGLLIFGGMLLFILAAFVGTLLIKIEYFGGTVDSLVQSFDPIEAIVENAETNDSETVPPTSDRASNTDIYAVAFQKLKSVIRSFIVELEWNDLWRIMGKSFLLMWAGYLLRSIAVVAGTQLVEFHSDE